MKATSILVVVVILLSIGTAPLTSAQEDVSCDPIQDVEICITEFTTPETLTEGETAQLSLRVQNVGNETGDTAVILSVKQPEGGFTYYLAEEINNLESGESKEVSLPIRFNADEPIGLHEVNVMLLDNSQEHLYDSTGFYNKIIVEENTDNNIDLVGWFKGLGELAWAALAIIAVLIFLFTGRFVW